jgi:hypothetical protein
MIGVVAWVVASERAGDDDKIVSLEMLFQLVILSLLLDRMIVSIPDPSDPAAELVLEP